jgi:hypothetical protein
MQITTLGIDVAKHVLQLHGGDKRGNVVLTKRLSRAKVLPFIAQLPPCLMGMEASGGAHYWAREFTKLGHTVQWDRANEVLSHVPLCRSCRAKNAAIGFIDRKFLPISNTTWYIIETSYDRST